MALKEILARFGFQVDGKALTQADEKIGGLLRSIRSLGPAISAAGIVLGVRQVIDTVGELQDTARSLSMPIAELQAWERWADRAGLGAQEITGALMKVQRAAANAADGGGELGATFEALGISVKNSDGSLRSSRDLMVDVLRGLSKTDDETKRTAVAMDVFGRSGGRILRALGQGDIGEFIANMDEVGSVTEEDAEKIDVMNDALTDAKSAFFSLGVEIVARAAPYMRIMFERAREAVRFISQLGKESNIAKAALITFAALGGKAVIGFLVRWIALNGALFVSQLKAFALIGLAILLIDELITTFQGGDTLIRRAIDGMFGEGTTAKVVATLSEWATKAKDFFAAIPGPAKAAAVGIGLVGFALGPVLSMMAGGIATALNFARALWPILGPIAPFVAGAALIVGAIWAIGEAFGGWQRIGEDFAYAWNDLWSGIVSTVTAAIDGIKAGIDKAGAFLGSIPGVSMFVDAQAPKVASAPQSAVGGAQVSQSVAQTNTIQVTVQGNAPPDIGRRIAGPVSEGLSTGLRGASASLSGAY